MRTTGHEEILAQVDVRERVLLLSHCLRPSQTCPGKFAKTGMVCPEDCGEDCVLRRFREVALKAGYKGVCIAAGGAMALRYARELKPQAIVAVACAKELTDGAEALKTMANNGEDIPVIVMVQLLRDGCVDTEVDEERVMKAITAGSLMTASA